MPVSSKHGRGNKIARNDSSGASQGYYMQSDRGTLVGDRMTRPCGRASSKRAYSMATACVVQLPWQLTRTKNIVTHVIRSFSITYIRVDSLR